jgi:hypothetical protein
MPTGDYQIVHPQLVAAGVAFRPGIAITDVADGRVVGLDATGRSTDVGEFDTVVLVYGRDQDDGLYQALAGRGKQVERIGDALAARKIDPAIYEGDRLGRAL